DPATHEIYTLSLHDALPIFPGERVPAQGLATRHRPGRTGHLLPGPDGDAQKDLPGARIGQAARLLQIVPASGGRLPVLDVPDVRSEEHTSELQSPYELVCRL